ncbi:MAG: alginate lyase family protein [Halomonas sp.]|uniref:Alginate lyase family protein n=1 Tax=Billgrantia antri TaxID=2846777 RepID=A0ABS6ZIQ4_9GAMM|nr:alginate lyase family protein [Halomonas antri]MBW6389618.1 alginate lyase family protein [Halomonas antri]MDX5379653.1 alginate lyase family protein [Halomonas sp.]
MPLAVAKGFTARLLRTLPFALLAMGGSAALADTLSREERMELDLSEYRVTDTDAGYFDVEARMALLDETDNSILLQLQDELETGPSCRQMLNFKPITTRGGIPGFYPSPEEWELATEPLFAFEDSVSVLAGSFVASGDTFYADCLVRFLHRWAEAKALTTFVFDPNDPQAWFAAESMIFAAAMAYSIVRPHVDGLQEERAEVEQWLHGLALQHSAFPGQPEESCCNNHFYRRALYASMIGVLVEDDDLFRFGVSAVYSALHDMTEEGALPLEVSRGRRATHYQNYALNYLITNMQIIQRQGYDIFNLEYEGNDIHEAVDYLFQILDNPAALGDYAPLEQYTGFLRDPQYFTWMEIYLTHFDHPPMERFLTRVRPTYNRSAGGYITLYFMDPEAQQHVYLNEKRRRTEAFRGLNN